MGTRMRIATTCTAAAMAMIAFTGQASATPQPTVAGGTASCSTTGARGSMGATRPSGDRWPYGEFKIALSLTDTSGDGHHVRIRLLTKPVGSQQIFTWPWHSLTAGAGNTLTLSTTAQSNIAETGVEVARFEGDHFMNSCTDWT